MVNIYQYNSWVIKGYYSRIIFSSYGGYSKIRNLQYSTSRLKRGGMWDNAAAPVGPFALCPPKIVTPRNRAYYKHSLLDLEGAMGSQADQATARFPNVGNAQTKVLQLAAQRRERTTE